MVAVYGNLMVMGVAVALFVATLNLGKRQPPSPEAEAKPHSRPVTDTHH